MDMIETRTAVSLARPELCAECPGVIEHVYVKTNYGPEGGMIRLTPEQVAASAYALKTWLHVGGGTSCVSPRKPFGMARPRTRCPKCHKRGTLRTTQEAWLDRTRCHNPRGCDYQKTYSIGD
jgi:hypothetical protein